jgi:UDP-N-acetylmuramate dehydrogenase
VPPSATGVQLAPLTTLRLGGPAARVVEARSDEDLIAAVRECDEAGEPLLVLAGGSNVVIADAGFAGTVVRVMTRGVERDGATLTVAAGEPWDSLVETTVNQGLTGIECLSGIPGSTGATPIQNVGAYGQDVAQTVTGVRVFDRERATVEELAADELGFAYRTSALRGDDRRIVLDVTFELTESELSAPLRYAELQRAVGAESAAPAEIRDAVLKLRRGKGMVIDPADPDSRSAGSFFTNPVVDEATAARVAARVEAAGQVPVTAWPQPGGLVKLSAAALIERAGIPRGHPGEHAPARVSTKHTLALTHRGGGTTDDLLALARDVRDRVDAAFGLVLEPEPVLVSCAL